MTSEWNNEFWMNYEFIKSVNASLKQVNESIKSMN
jgi:hypothetical protein